MADFLNGVGRMFVFSMLFPGVIGFTAVLILFPRIRVADFSTINLSLLIVFLGFIANVIGYSLDICIQFLAGKKNGSERNQKDLDFELNALLSTYP